MITRVVTFLQRTIFRRWFIVEIGSPADCRKGQKLNLGCGLVAKPDGSWVFADLSPRSTADVVLNVERDLPFRDCSFDYVLLDNVVEHVHDLVCLMRSTWAVLKPSGYLEIRCPHSSDTWAWGDPTHVRGISENTILYFTDRWQLAKIYDITPFRVVYLKADRRYRGSGIHAILQKADSEHYVGSTEGRPGDAARRNWVR